MGAAALSLAGNGPDQTEVSISAVPGLERNCHDIEVEGEFGLLHVHIENIPPAAGQWDVPGLRGAAKLSATLQSQYEDALLFRRIATIETDVAVGAVDDWRWTGPTDGFDAVADEIGSPELAPYARRLAGAR